jgi:hypothetical protein
MNPLKEKLIDDQSSPLFRIMSVYDDADATRRKFDANVSAFHIGKGYVLSVSHYLHMRFALPWSIPDSFFQSEILSKFSRGEPNHISRHFPLDSSTNKRYLTVSDQQIRQDLAKKFREHQCDTRVQTFYSHRVCKPFLIVQFRNNQFFGDPKATAQIDLSHVFHELDSNHYTFLLELEVSKVFSKEDITVNRVTNVSPDVICLLPSISVDYSIYDDESTGNLYCLQNSPSGSNLGRLLNRAQIDGVLDHHGVIQDEIAGNVLVEGLRYLIRGYFRFGSSGAPYVRFDDTTKQFAAVAIQSEACPIQLTIKNDREGQFSIYQCTRIATVFDRRRSSAIASEIAHSLLVRRDKLS